MYSAPNKKLQERAWMQSFITLRSKSMSQMEVVEHEAPDFILIDGKKQISVEITALVDPKLKQVESLKQQIVRKAHEKSNNKFGNNLHVNVGFTEEPIRMSESEIDACSKNLSESVAGMYERYNVKDIRGFQTFQDQFEDGIIYSISLSPNQQESQWYTFDSFAFRHIEPKLVIGRISKKEANLVKYAKQYNENWLLMVANLWDESSSYDFTNLKKNLKLDTAFHQVFIYQSMENRFIRLK